MAGTQSDEPSVSPWKPFGQVLAMTDEELSEYYSQIAAVGLTSLQKAFLDAHVNDLAAAANHPRTRLRRARTHPLYALLRFVVSGGFLALRSAFANPTGFLTDPVNWAASVSSSIGLFLALTTLHCVFLFGHYIGAPKLIRWLSRKYADGQCVVTWPAVGFYSRKTPVMQAAMPVLAGAPPQPYNASSPVPLSPQKTVLEFNVDVAMALIVMASIVYERDDGYLKQATEHPESGAGLLLRSEELMYAYAKEWGLEFTSISDLELVAGPYVAAFYKIKNLREDEHPFIVLVVKGTSPGDLAEWITDATLNLEDSSDWLGAGEAHEGFYTSLFPPTSSDMRIMPYTRIIDVIRTIAEPANDADVLAPPRLPKKTNLFVTGHSLGAGIASLLYARLLEEPDDVGERVVVRDAYLFGTPRACNGALVSRIERNLRRPCNHGKAIWRVANRRASRVCGDIVTRIPPGLADDRHMRSKLKPSSMLSYGAIGIGVDLTPYGPAPFFRLGPIPVGLRVAVVEEGKHDALDFGVARKKLSRREWPDNVVEWLTLGMKIVAPFVSDHGPTEYFESLCAVQGRLRIHPPAQRTAFDEQDDPPSPSQDTMVMTIS